VLSTYSDSHNYALFNEHNIKELLRLLGTAKFLISSLKRGDNNVLSRVGCNKLAEILEKWQVDYTRICGNMGAYMRDFGSIPAGNSSLWTYSSSRSRSCNAGNRGNPAAEMPKIPHAGFLHHMLRLGCAMLVIICCQAKTMRQAGIIF
jgi:hypothetical protein